MPWPVGVAELDECSVESHVEGVVSITLPDSEAQWRQFNQLLLVFLFIRTPSGSRRCGVANEDEGPLALSQPLVLAWRLPYLSLSEG